MSYFETHNLSVGYGNTPLIRDICLSVEQGEILTLIGPNGGGKSTILKSIARHLRWLNGKVSVDGQDLSHLNNRQMARRISVMLTERIAPELMTCGDVVESGRYPYTDAIGRMTPEDRAIVEDSLRKVRALELRDRPFGAVSDGQRQRVMLARAICQQPDVIVLDEPTSFLDIRHKIELLDILREMARIRRITVLMSLHEIDLAAKVSDLIVCVKGDAIERFGPPESIFSDEAIADLYDMQSGSYSALLGSMELAKPVGTARAFVAAGAGRGVPFYRALQKRGIPFAAGILFDNDMDYPVARALAAKVFAGRAFLHVPDQVIDDAVRLAAACDCVLDAGTPRHRANARFFEAAAQNGTRIITSLEEWEVYADGR